MSGSAEVQTLLVIVVIALVVRNAWLKREKKLLYGQLCGMQGKGAGKSAELIATGKQEIAAEIKTEHSCPNCKSGPAEIYERSGDGESWICRACYHTWVVPHYCPVVPVTAPAPNRGWTFSDQNPSCPDCGSTEFEMRTYGGPWEYADTHCAMCGKLILRFDEANTRHLSVQRVVRINSASHRPYP